MEMSSQHTGRFTPRERASGTHRIGGWMGPRAGLKAAAKRKISCLCRESNPGRPARVVVIIHMGWGGGGKEK